VLPPPFRHSIRVDSVLWPRVTGAMR
jgi:hypothetical protein